MFAVFGPYPALSRRLVAVRHQDGIIHGCVLFTRRRAFVSSVGTVVAGIGDLISFFGSAIPIISGEVSI